MLSSTKSSSTPTSILDKMDDIKKMGYLKKLKTMKKKYFILRVESESGPSRLEYYDNEKKWKVGHPPKRAINLKTCFNINRKLDTKQKCVIALYTKDDSFAISLESEAELEEWLVALLQLQHGEEYLETDEKPKPTFEHVWQVNVKNRGLGSSKNILGPYRLCLTERALSLIQMSSNEPAVFEFPLVSIRRCGNSDSFFFMEVGRNAITGAGELWMLTEDTLIAQNMHETILNAMKSSHKDDVVPRTRPRSSSTNEASKPISVHSRRQQTNPMPTHVVSRDRADSMPNRPRTISDGQREGGTKTCRLAHNLDRPSSMYAQAQRSSCSPSSGFISMSGVEGSFSVDEYDSSPPEILLQKFTAKESSHEDSYMPMAPGETESKPNQDDGDGYMPMNQSAVLDFPLTPPHPETSVSNSSQAHDGSLTSPPTWLALGSNAGALSSNLASSPPLVSSVGSDYLEMASPAGNSSVGTPDGYMPMSPVGSLYTYSHISSLSRQAVKTPSPAAVLPPLEKSNKYGEGSGENLNGYVPMAPVKESLPSLLKVHSPQEDEGYMDMNPAARSLSRGTNDCEQKVGSSSRRSSVTSGTPSTDMCFAEYQLEKVRAYFTPTDEDEPIVRAYSIGSRTDCERKNKLEMSSDSSRARAYSFGSKVGVKFGNKLSGTSTDSPAIPKAVEEKGKKCSSAPVLGTSPFSNSWSDTSFLNRMNSTSRSSNTNEDLMEMDFPESNNHSSGNISQGFWIDGSRKSGAVSSGSSTDSLRRTPTGNRPRSNSRSSHSRPSKLETLQSIGEKSGSKSPPSEGIPSSKPVRNDNYTEIAELSKSFPKSPPRDSYTDVGGRLHSGAPITVSALTASLGDTSKMSKVSPNLHCQLTSQRSQDYVNMTCSEVTTKSSDEKEKGERKCSLPVSIHGARQIENKALDHSFESGEYVSIDMSCGFSESPAAFSIINASVTAPVTLASKISSSLTYSSAGFPSSGSSNLQRPSGNLLSPTPVPKLQQQTPEVKPSHEYVNLQYGKRLHGHQAVGSEAGSCPVSSASAGMIDIDCAISVAAVSAPSFVSQNSTTSTTSLSKSLLSHPSRNISDYAIMAPSLQGITNLPSQTSNPLQTMHCPSGIKMMTVSSPASVATDNFTSLRESLDKIASTLPCSPTNGVSPNAAPAEPALCVPLEEGSERNSFSDSAEDRVFKVDQISDVSCSSPIPPLIESQPSTTSEQPYENISVGRTSRPNSVSSERELNYASLDLVSSSATPEESETSPRSSRGSLKNSVVPSGSSSNDDSSLLSYAKIDFTKSDGLRCTTSSTLENRK